MQEGKVSIADGPIETRDNLHGFKTEYNRTHPKDRLKTLAEAIDKLIEIAGRNDKIMKDYQEIRDAFAAYKENFQPKIENYEARIEELESKVEKLEAENKKLKGDS